MVEGAIKKSLVLEGVDEPACFGGYGAEGFGGVVEDWVVREMESEEDERGIEGDIL